MRIKFFGITIIAAFIFLLLGLFNLQVIQGRTLRSLSQKNCIRILPQPGGRGKILDRQGNAIVDNYLAYDLMLIPSDSREIEKILPALAGVLQVPVKQLRINLKKEYQAPFIPVAIAKDIEPKKAIMLEELKTEYPLIMIQPRPQRHYPYGRLGSHLLGYLDEIDTWRLTKLESYGYKTKDIVGYTGIEEKYDYYLRQEDGALSVEVDHRGRPVRVVGLKSAQSGKDIALTIDLKIQKIAEEKLGAREGSVVLMQPASGEILAMASFPDFNPEVFLKKPNPAINALFSDPNAPLLNRATSGLYPPASVFKLPVASAALETKKINLGTVFYCPGSMNIGGRRFNCWEAHQEQDLIKAITDSCDVFFYHAGLLLQAKAMHDSALRFGFGKTSGIDLPYEAAGFVPDPLWKRMARFQKWYDGDTANFSIGQGDLLVTPLQITRMMAVFANGGFLVTPYLAKSIDHHELSLYQRKLIRLGLNDKIINSIRQGLRRVVSDPVGTANNLSVLPVAVAGKTGSAQVPKGLAHGWFAGFFPFENPQFVICVFLEHGGSGHAAAAIAKEVIDAMSQEGLI